MEIIRPQKGFQENFLSSSADIVIAGGAAGLGKSFALLLEPLRHHQVENFEAVIFRRTVADITKGGGILDTAQQIFPNVGARIVRSPQNVAIFPAGGKVQFNGLQYEKDIYSHQGAQYAFIGFDELTHFTEKMFFYLLSRNRSVCGVKPYVRATTNPDPDSWVCDFIDWWINPVTGFPIPEREGKLRYFTKKNDVYIWGDSAQEVIDQYPDVQKYAEMAKVDIVDLIKSVTFISGKISDNQKLLEKDPAYLANLLTQTAEEKAKLLDGNWKIRTDGLNIAKAEKIAEIFTNVINDGGRNYITIDHAREGRDLCVVLFWEGWRVEQIHVFTTSDTDTIVKCINDIRAIHNIGSGAVICDQDGIGVIDAIKCKVFLPNGTPLDEPETRQKGNYQMLKTQCNYRTCELRINKNAVWVTSSEIFVDGVKNDCVSIKSKTFNIPSLIKRQLRTIRKVDPDSDGKKKMIKKEDQKTLLSGMSPDFADAFAMREWFELKNVGDAEFEVVDDVWEDNDSASYGDSFGVGGDSW